MMTQKSVCQVEQGDRNLLHYRLTSEEWLRACRELKPSEKDILYYLRTLDPFGDRELDIKVRHIARALDISPSTVSRGLKSLDVKGWIDLEVLTARVKLHSNPVEKVLPHDNTVAPMQQRDRIPVEKVLPHDNTVAPTQQVLPHDNKMDRHATLGAKISSPVENLQPISDKDFSDSEFSTECTRSVLKHLKQEQTGSPTTHPVEKNREEIGTLGKKVVEAGVAINAALAATLTEVHCADPEQAQVRLRNALSALQEQKNVRNPQAFLNSALRRGFTANEAKRKQNSIPKSDLTPAAPPRDLSDLIIQIDLACDRLGISRTDAIARMAQAYGWQSRPFQYLDEGDLEILVTVLNRWE